jgi:hypothetical protein
MKFESFLAKCQDEPTVSDFESYLSFCIFEKRGSGRQECSPEMYSFIRDQAFDRRDEKAARTLYDLAKASEWDEGEWEGALK